MAKKNALPDRKKDPAGWYHEVIARAELAEATAVSGCMAIRPYGHAIWELTRDALDARIKAHGAQNVSFPMLIPESFLAREKEHVEGFAPECAVVTEAGGKVLEERLIVRPTSETIIHESMARWIDSYRDLPMRINQWGTVVRWEKRSLMFIRNREFHWHEGHTAHATEDEARREVRTVTYLYRDYLREVLAVPGVPGTKTDKEKFAGAVESCSVEGMMQNGKALQIATIHYLGDRFSRMANVRYLDGEGVHRFAQMTSWGTSTRLIGAVILTHGDDKGLVLPPAVAPIQVVIVPIVKDGDAVNVMKVCDDIAGFLRKSDVRVHIDDRTDMSVGAKFYHWEVRGVPFRIEIGSRDLERKAVMLASRIGDKRSLSLTDIRTIPDLLSEYHVALWRNATARLAAEQIHTAATWEAFTELAEAQAGFIRAMWCGSRECEEAIKAQTNATTRNMPFEDTEDTGACIWCGKKGGSLVYFAKAY